MRCAAVRKQTAVANRMRQRPWRRLASLLIAGLLAMAPGADAAAVPEQPLSHATATVQGHGSCGVPKTGAQPVAARVVAGALPSPVVVHALCAASEAAHTDPFLLLAMAWEESRFDPMARNRFSSARGLLQFTVNTWLTVVREFGAQYGLGKLAATIHTDPDGRIWVTSWAVRAQILRLRDNPELEAIMASESLDQQRAALQQAIGRTPRPADLYLLHLLGPAGARDFLLRLARTPNARSVDVIGREAAHNTSLFLRDGRWLSLAQTYADLRQALKVQVELHAGLFAPAG